MTWIKRNLFFVIGAVVSLALLSFAGFYNYSGWSHNTKEKENRIQKYEDLKRLYNLNPNPGFGKVDNIKAAREQQKKIQAVLAKAADHFRQPAAIPDKASVTSSEFQAALRRTVDQLTREASVASVLLPQDYKFSFFQQFRQLNFAPGSLEPLAVQLGEVKALCDVLIKAKVNYIDLIQRERVSPDDAMGPPTDYVDLTSQPNELATMSPYKITFRSFSPEIAHVLMGFANSRHGFIVQSIEVKPAAATASDQTGFMPAASYLPAPAPVQVTRRTMRNVAQEEAAERHALRPDLYPAPSATSVPGVSAYTQPAYTPPTAYSPTPSYGAPVPRTGPAGSQIALSERPLEVTLLVQVVKLLPKR